MVVIKLGGSLLASGWLGKCLDTIERDYVNRAVVIVPGGGIFADQVRQLQQQWHFDDRTAHMMAILAIQQMALLIKGLKADFQIIDKLLPFQDIHGKPAISIWSPDIADLDADNVPANWQVTSDSLAAWFAKTVAASRLIVVKSAAIDKNLSNGKLAEQGIVDPLFNTFTQAGTFSTTIVNVKNFIYGCCDNGYQ